MKARPPTLPPPVAAVYDRRLPLHDISPSPVPIHPLGGPDNLLSGWPQATGGDCSTTFRSLPIGRYPATSCALRAPGQLVVRATRSLLLLISSGALLVLSTVSSLAAATLHQSIDRAEFNVGDEAVVSYTVENGSGVNIRLPVVDGLQVLGTFSATNMTLNNGSFSSAYTESFHVAATRPGDFTIPAFDIHLQDGGILHTQAIKMHILGDTNPPPPAPAPINAPTNAPQTPAFNPNGPVVYPPNNNPPGVTQSPPNPAVTSNNSNIPVGPDGRPPNVFIVITPQTTEGYVGESIPMTIEFYISLDVAAQQDSLPTIKGSDFLMNSLNVRFRSEELGVLGQGFHRETWYTAISAPKSGDFPLQMERDTYWRKSNPANNDPFTNFFPSRPDLAHQPVSSNQLTMHIHPLPDEGRPAGFTGAIGQFNVTGSALPATVAVGEPVTLHFTVTGQGNFDYVRCPALADDPAWKTYVPSSKIEYQDDSHTQGVKNFEMAIIPQKNGTLPLPKTNFSYFDPTSKQYVTTPINLPDIIVTGSAAAPVALAGTGPDAAATIAGAPPAAVLQPNRLDVGSPQTSLQPVYWQTWFWAVQGGLVATVALCGGILFLRSRPKKDDGRSAQLEREVALEREVDAMTDAVKRRDTVAFFHAARHAVQLHLAAQWRVAPDTLSLAEIRRRDPVVADSLEPLFAQADEIIYSGGTSTSLDLAHWARQVREILQPHEQPSKP